jgi:acyl carrier protein
VSEAVVRQMMRQHILENYLFTDDGSALDDSQSFMDSRTIDSMGMMQLIQFIETTFKFTLQEADMTPERLDSVDRLVRFILDRVGQA